MCRVNKENVCVLPNGRKQRTLEIVRIGTVALAMSSTMPACGWQQHRKRVLSIVHDAGRKAYKRHSTGHVVGFRDCMLCGDWLSSNARMHVKSSSSVRAMSCGETVCLTKGKILLKSTLSRVASHTSMPSSGPKIKKSPCVTVPKLLTRYHTSTY